MAKRIAIMLASWALITAALIGGAAAQDDLGLAVSVYTHGDYAQSWQTLAIVNEGIQETEIKDITINNRNECTQNRLTSFSLWAGAELSLSDQHIMWLHQNQKQILWTPNGKYRKDDDKRDFNVSTAPIVLRVGDEGRWIPSGCNRIVRATIVTDRGSGTFEFRRQPGY